MPQGGSNVETGKDTTTGGGDVKSGKGRLLIVDDEVAFSRVIKDSLEEEGYTCFTAPSGNSALELLANEPVDLALVDIVMEGMTGLGLFQHARALHPHLPLIFMTAMDDMNVAVDQLKQGAYDFLVKPVQHSRLQRAVEEALERHSASLEESHLRTIVEERISGQTTKLEATVRELSSLNRLFQAELTQRFALGEAAYLKRIQAMRETRLRRGLIASQVSEKRRISAYLRGHVASRLEALQHKLARCRNLASSVPEETHTLLEEIESGLRSIQQVDIRQASHQLYPEVVEVGLVPALRSLAGRFRHLLPVELCLEPRLEREETEETEGRTLPEEFRVGVYRIVEEALDNVVTHAGAHTARVEVSYVGTGRVSLEITDDGRGFRPGAPSPAHGLLAIKDYAEGLGGSCSIESVPGQGTTIRVPLPLPGRGE